MNNKPHIIEFEKIGNSSIGFITVSEYQKNIPFEIKRVYWTYYTPNESIRGGHAHKKLNQVIFALSGKITLTTEDLNGSIDKFILDSPHKGLFVPEKIWRDIEFSHNAVLLCLASLEYSSEDYIRDYNVFKKLL
jgi:hypothetical protein